MHRVSVRLLSVSKQSDQWRRRSQESADPPIVVVSCAPNTKLEDMVHVWMGDPIGITVGHDPKAR